ncbi:hypothetical protein [Pelotomaculum propionicicum]|uniref:Stage III sporulation protein AG n=1 Tax=Pelotomaculum propionicicum TaxID=258475 RepID=A0A4Y7RJS2_9FIRM|nr:hypothetical protein [Pelotomaculum propionicicum]NLI11989.1 hypothetical protein [Peptococcaceae bacterium]TEB08922.1 hypothetical protein Pmgp_03534 [Pelotomaculum propionicicum]
MRKLLDLFGFGGKSEDGFFAREKNRRNLWLAGLAAVGVALLVLSGINGVKAGGQQDVVQQTSPAREHFTGGMTAEEEQLGKKLCEMLRQVEGAGRVEVSVRLSGSTRSEYAVNVTTGKKTTQEKDQAGGTRVTTEDSGSEQLVMNRGGNGGEQPVTEREVAPQIAGVLVVAEGAVDSRVKAKIFAAAQVALGVEPQRILVLPMERRT